MDEKVSSLKQKTKVEKATSPLWGLADGISKVGSHEGLRSWKWDICLEFCSLPPFQLHLCIGQRVQAPQILAQLHFFCFNFLCTFLPLEGLTVTFTYSRFQSDVRRFNFLNFSFFEMFVNFLTCRFHKWDPQCSWERKTSEHLDTITSMSFPIGKEGDVLAKGKSSN